MRYAGTVPDPLLSLRVSDVELRSVDPLLRAKLRMEAGERREAAAAAEAAEARRDAHELAVQQQAAHDRIELATQGHLSREAQAIRAEWEQRRRGRLAELRTELDRLEGSGEVRLPGAGDVDRELEASRAERDAWEQSPAIRRMRAASAAAAARTPYSPPVLSRSAGLPDPRTMTSRARQAEIAALEAELAARPGSRSSSTPPPRRARPVVDPRVRALDRLPFGSTRRGDW
jgi:hypothetical protein